jgi:hypothetical protein
MTARSDWSLLWVPARVLSTVWRFARAFAVIMVVFVSSELKAERAHPGVEAHTTREAPEVVVVEPDVSQRSVRERRKPQVPALGAPEGEQPS